MTLESGLRVSKRITNTLQYLLLASPSDSFAKPVGSILNILIVSEFLKELSASGTSSSSTKSTKPGQDNLNRLWHLTGNHPCKHFSVLCVYRTLHI